MRQPNQRKHPGRGDAIPLGSGIGGGDVLGRSSLLIGQRRDDEHLFIALGSRDGPDHDGVVGRVGSAANRRNRTQGKSFGKTPTETRGDNDVADFNIGIGGDIAQHERAIGLTLKNSLRARALNHSGDAGILVIDKAYRRRCGGNLDDLPDYATGVADRHADLKSVGRSFVNRHRL